MVQSQYRLCDVSNCDTTLITASCHAYHDNVSAAGPELIRFGFVERVYTFDIMPMGLRAEIFGQNKV